MDKMFQEQIDGLLEKYTELLLGETSEEWKEKVQTWALYSHIAKSMPALAKHWNGEYPEAKKKMVQIVQDIKEMNEKQRSK
ncbi:YusU family protein [Ectobacillus sp. sgz5001026]|uniref:YusU family protein n=1 Tax=Ectobacillus sp. sgz5001026 TaxID=3242473 RepID=UPI0036D297D0